MTITSRQESRNNLHVLWNILKIFLPILVKPLPACETAGGEDQSEFILVKNYLNSIRYACYIHCLVGRSSVSICYFIQWKQRMFNIKVSSKFMFTLSSWSGSPARHTLLSFMQITSWLDDNDNCTYMGKHSNYTTTRHGPYPDYLIILYTKNSFINKDVKIWNLMVEAGLLRQRCCHHR